MYFPGCRTASFRRSFYHDLTDNEALGRGTCRSTHVKVQVHINVRENALYLKVGFWKEINQFFDFISPAMVYQLLHQLEAEKKRRGMIYIYIYHGPSEVCYSLLCKTENQADSEKEWNSTYIWLRLQWHVVGTVFYYSWTPLSYCPDYFQLAFQYLMLIICLLFCLGFVSFSHCWKKKKGSWMFKATRQFRWQRKKTLTVRGKWRGSKWLCAVACLVKHITVMTSTASRCWGTLQRHNAWRSLVSTVSKQKPLWGETDPRFGPSSRSWWFKPGREWLSSWIWSKGSEGKGRG